MPSEKINTRVCFFNDRSEYNVRYRQSLMDLLRGEGYSVFSTGWSGDELPRLFKSLFFFCQSEARIVSNLKSNLLVMGAVPLVRALVIINGLGRLRQNRAFRWCLLVLMAINFRKSFAVQNPSGFQLSCL